MKTPAERQAARRARLKSSELQEVRGIFLPPELHSALKAYALRLQPLLPGGNTGAPTAPLWGTP